jgi:phage gp37-like protein
VKFTVIEITATKLIKHQISESRCRVDGLVSVKSERKYAGSLVGSVVLSIAAAFALVLVAWIGCGGSRTCQPETWSPFAVFVILVLLVAAAALGLVLWTLTRVVVALMKNPGAAVVFLISALLDLVIGAALIFALASLSL